MNFNSLSKTEKHLYTVEYQNAGIDMQTNNVLNIGIISTYCTASSAHKHLKQINKDVKSGIVSAGGKCQTFYISGVSPLMAQSPNIASNMPALCAVMSAQTEALITINKLDGVVITSSHSAETTALIIGAIRAKVPFVVQTSGSNTASDYKGKNISARDVMQFAGSIAGGKLNSITATEQLANACPTLADGEHFYGNNSLAVCLEALGLSVIDSACPTSTSGAKQISSILAGSTAVTVAKNQIMPKKIITKASLQNAIATNLALGGCVQSIMQLLQIAKECDVNFKPESFNDTFKKAPVLFNNQTSTMNNLNDAGGVKAVIKALTKYDKLIDTNTTTVQDTTLAKLIQPAPSPDDEVIKMKGCELSKTASVAVLKGTMAESYSFVNTYNTNEITDFTGKAWVYDTPEDALESVIKKNIPSKSVVVVKNCNTPNGQIAISSITNAISGMGLQSQIVVATDGTYCNSSNAICVSGITPTTEDCKTFAIIQTNDEINIDFTKYKINVNINAKDLKTRTKHASAKTIKPAFLKNIK